MQIVVRTSPDYEMPDGIRAALEHLAEAIVTEEAGAEVQGFAGTELATQTDPLALQLSKFGPKDPLQGICFFTFTASDEDGNQLECNWVFSW